MWQCDILARRSRRAATLRRVAPEGAAQGPSPSVAGLRSRTGLPSSVRRPASLTSARVEPFSAGAGEAR